MAVVQDKIAEINVNQHAALMLEHRQGDICTVLDPTKIECFPTSEFLVQKGSDVLPQWV